MINLLDKYFRSPVKYDYIVTILILLFFKKYILNSYICLPNKDEIFDLASEIVTILLTLAGFILTFLTVLITFKLDAGKYKSKPEEEMSILEKFSHSGLYYQTTEIFKNSIKSIITISIIIYLLRIFSSKISISEIFIAAIAGVIILVLTLIRNLVILDKILDLQKEDISNKTSE
ncbi:hypothetical protein [Sphingobacterium sp.]|uniref:hypothetical protein n=1 Tax=Sphingobacterium sp. TaxID=341027 RepID=UPI002FDE3B42